MHKRLTLLVWLLTTAVISAQEFKALDQLNTSYRETNLSITPNGKYLFFMSHRGGQSWSVGGYSGLSHADGGFDGDIWYSYNKDGVWQKPRVLNYPINTSKGEDEPSISMDGQKVYFQSWRSDWPSTGGPYYEAQLDGQKWKRPRGVGGEITRFFQLQQKIYDYALAQRDSWLDMLMGKAPPFGTDGMAVSPDGKIMVISFTNYERKEHNMDLFISRKDRSGQWSYPKKLRVNTLADEISAFIAGDNRTLYFASNRRGGSGGFDIYKTILTEGAKCEQTENLGSPYNTSRDDYGFIVNSLGDKGYMIRDGDIYEITLTEKAKPERTLVVNGLVRDDKGNRLQAKVEVKISDKKFTTVSSNRISGEYSFALPWPSGTLTQTALLPDGRTQSIERPVTGKTQSPMQIEIVFPTPLAAKPEPEPEPKKQETANKLEKRDLVAGQIILAENLFFEADASTIQQSSFTNLDKIAAVLSKRTDLIIEIGGHTNGQPPHEYCDSLSASRAKAVFEYLVAEGVPEKVLRHKGYGKRKPIASNRTAAGRKRNQRVEFKILRVD